MDTAEESGPFAGGGLTLTAAAQPTSAETAGWVEELGLLASPFADAYRTGEGDEETDAVDVLVHELDDEEFEQAIENLIDEVAARHLSSVPSWSSETGGPTLTSIDAENWMAAQAAKVDRYLEHLEHHFADRPVESLTDDEIDVVVDQFAVHGGGLTATGEEEIFGFAKRLAKKVVSGAKAVAKKGIQLAGRLLPVGRIIAMVRRMIPALLRKVVQRGINLLPQRLRGPAQHVARGLTAVAAPGSGAEVAEEFDDQLARALLAPNESAADQILAEAEAETAQPTVDPLAALDEARARLTRDLAEAAPGEPPVAPIEQFIPAVMAAMPLIKKGISILGLRPKIKDVLAKGLALLIKDHVGPQMAQALAPRVADAGLKMLGLETADATTLGAEALVATLEETIREVVELPDESLDEPLRVQAEIEHAFAEAATHYLPARSCGRRSPRSRPTTRAPCGSPCPGRRVPAIATGSALGCTAFPSDARRHGRSSWTMRTPSRSGCSTAVSAAGRWRQRSTCTRRCPAPAWGTSPPSRSTSPRSATSRCTPTSSRTSLRRSRRCCSAGPVSDGTSVGRIAAAPSVRGTGCSGWPCPGCRCGADTVGWRSSSMSLDPSPACVCTSGSVSVRRTPWRERSARARQRP